MSKGITNQQENGRIDANEPILICGLGNPGLQYQGTRHNVGQWALSAIVDHLGLQRVTVPSQLNAQVWRETLNGYRLFAWKTTDYMNHSGVSLSATARYFKIPPHNVVVLHDDMDLALGTLRAKFGGSDGGHNGLKSVTRHIGSQYFRFRIGVAHPGERRAVVHHVLGRFSTEEQQELEPCLHDAVRLLPLLWEDGLSSLSMELGQSNRSRHSKPST